MYSLKHMHVSSKRRHSGYSLLIILLIAFILASGIHEQHSSLWHQRKVLNLERVREIISNQQAVSLDLIVNHLISYKELSLIPDKIVVKHNNFALKCNMLVSEHVEGDLPNSSCIKYKIFKAEIDSSFDFSRFSGYHKKMTSTYLYVLACETLNHNDSSDQHIQINAFPLSKFIIGD